MKDKRVASRQRNVFHRDYEGQKRAGIRANCPFGGLKKTKESRTRGKLSIWRSQKDKRNPDQGQIVLLGGSKRQKKAGPLANCSFGGLKKTKESWNPGKLSFWRSQKDKRELESEQTVLLEVLKRQKRNARATSCPSPGPGKKNKKQTAPF
ncbi:hypothetical protein [Heyndrickxia coagulans]|uniref:hypothetical protein n=1 Tax=Heyndrickxia coagulans TaxID=1398 RepID=UPI001F1D296E|nr:hypothetical protein [Heyndrickxia coagulans]